MGYQDEYNKARGKGKTKTLTKQIFTFEAEGDTLIGKVIKIEPFTEGSFETEVNSYIIETDTGTVCTVLGSATDKQLKSVDPIGQNIYIEYQGKKQLKDGRSVNLYHVEVF